MADHRDDAAIRARAYQLWIESGYADGYQDAHWRQAEREAAEKAQVREVQSGAGDAAPAPNRVPDPAARHSDGMSTFPSVLDPGPGRAG